MIRTLRTGGSEKGKIFKIFAKVNAIADLHLPWQIFGRTPQEKTLSQLIGQIKHGAHVFVCILHILRMASADGWKASLLDMIHHALQRPFIILFQHRITYHTAAISPQKMPKIDLAAAFQLGMRRRGII
ncbi:MAG: hypothetical protein Q4G00_02185 [Clostridia bacterium]|nr:hypothetical protein [Clostridia bacterium]